MRTNSKEGSSRPLMSLSVELDQLKQLKLQANQLENPILKMTK